MQQYNGMAYRLTLLEVQKLAYFLQESGEPLKLNYVAHTYGPYAENLNKVLQAIEGISPEVTAIAPSLIVISNCFPVRSKPPT